MWNWIIQAILHYRVLILLLMLILLGWGGYQAVNLPVEAFPDISPVMVPVFAEAHGMAPEEIEQLITIPIESTMNGLPGIRSLKSTSAFGMAVIYVYFEEDTDIYFARQLVSERLNAALPDLPDMHEPPTLGPISTGLGQIFIYTLSLSDEADTGELPPDVYLRDINDWMVKYRLQSVPGVTDILSIGGHVLQYQIQIDPFALQYHRLGLDDLIRAVQSGNRNAGGQFVVLNHEEHLIRGIGLVRNLDDIADISIKTVHGISLKVRDVANVSYGNQLRRGAVSRNGDHEVVSGIVLQLYGANTSEVIENLYERLDSLKTQLPTGVELNPFYEQAELVRSATATVSKALLMGGVLVLIVLFLFLGNIRTALIVALSLPFSALVAFIVMGWVGISANLMSLGGIAIAIGMLGDGTIVMVENIFRHLIIDTDSLPSVIRKASGEVVKPIVFSILIIITVFLPILTLRDIEGKMFRPMALTLTSALLGSMAMAIIIAPVLCRVWLKKKTTSTPPSMLLRFRLYYSQLLETIQKRGLIVLSFSLLLLLSGVFLLPVVGTEFIPTLEEGSILIGVTMPPSISLPDALDTIRKLEKKIMQYDEVEEVLSRVGRPETGSHPHPVNYAEVHIRLKHDCRVSTRRELVELLRDDLSTYPGIRLNFTQPIQNAFDELLTGTRSQLAVTLYGEDRAVLEAKAHEIMETMEEVKGLTDLSTDQGTGQPHLSIDVDRDACSRYGVRIDDVMDLVEYGIGGEVIGQVFLNTRRYGIQVRLGEAFRNNPEAIHQIPIVSTGGYQVPLKQVARITLNSGPVQINRENSQRRWSVQANIRGRDLGSTVKEIKRLIRENVTLPPGIFLDFGGQFKNQKRAMVRFSWIVPLVTLLVLLLIRFTFDSWKLAGLIFLTIPMSLVGGIWGLFLTGEYLSVPAAVGFIALLGISVQNGLVLIGSIRQKQVEGLSRIESIREGAVLRFRPVLMTVSTTVLGLLPLILSGGIGSEIQRPLAVVVVFGLMTATFGTLFLLPVVYSRLGED